MRYFEKNIARGMDLINMHDILDPDEDESAREAAKMFASLIFGRL